MYMWRKLSTNFGIEAHLVADMREIGFARSNSLHNLKSLRKTEMGEVLGLAERIDNKDVNTFELVELVGVDMVGVSDIAQTPYTIAQNGQSLVHGFDGNDRDAAKMQLLIACELMKSGFGQAWELVVVEYIMIISLDGNAGLMVAEDIHLLVLYIVEGADIIDATNMIAVGMGDKNSIKMRDMLAEHLLAEVGTDINENIVAAVGFDKGRSAQMPIMPVVRGANRALTSNYGYPLRGTRT